MRGAGSSTQQASAELHARGRAIAEGSRSASSAGAQGRRAQGAVQPEQRGSNRQPQADTGRHRHGSFQATCQSWGRRNTSRAVRIRRQRPLSQAHPSPKKKTARPAQPPPATHLLSAAPAPSLLLHHRPPGPLRRTLQRLRQLSAARVIMDAPEPDTPFAAVSAQTTKYGQASRPVPPPPQALARR